MEGKKMKGEYNEKLPCGGNLIVNDSSWKIEYHFLGSDMRYTDTMITIYGQNINDYILAWEENFEDYKTIKSVIPPGDFCKIGKMGMNIRLGFAEGVCLKSYHMPIKTEKELENVIKSYDYAQDRAQKIIKMLRNL